MNKTKDTSYLFRKMSPVEENGPVIAGSESDKIMSQTRTTYRPDENSQIGEQGSVKKWIGENVMLLVTLLSVFVGAVTGASFD